MRNLKSFQPNWAVPPGTTIKSALSRRQLEEADLARALDRSPEEVHGLLSGTQCIDRKLAELLELHVGGTSEFWICREQQYREDLSRLTSNSIEEWAASFPKKLLVGSGWVTPGAGESFGSALLKFFGVASLSDWTKQYESTPIAAFRTSSSFAQNENATAAWLRRGELIAQNSKCEKWSRTKLRSRTSDIRKLTKYKEPERFLPALSQLLAECGVALSVVKA
ncbi:MAG: hypothetical protein EOP06_17990, partial [Proteobacteria bacterium]